MRVLSVGLIVGLLCMGSVHGAVYNLPSHLINIPIVNSYDQWDMEFGVSTGFNNNEIYEFDSKFNVAITNRAMLGFNWVNKANVATHFHYNIYGDETSLLSFAGGVTNMIANKTLSSWNTYVVTQNTQISPYFVTSIHTKLMYFHVGLGGNRFQYAEKASASLDLVKGLFFGVEVPFHRSRIGFEYDGKDFNLGVRFSLNKYSDIFSSLTEIGNSGTTNPQYSNTPVRYFSFGLQHRFNFRKLQAPEKETLATMLAEAEKAKKEVLDLLGLYRDEIEQLRLERQALEEQVGRLQKAVEEDLRYIDESDGNKRNQLREEYLAQTQDVSEEVIQYYYQSFDYFSQKKHYKAIELLQKAIVLNPYIPQLYVRLGSVYYDLDLVGMAVTQWEKALELDPDNLKLKQVLQKLNVF